MRIRPEWHVFYSRFISDTSEVYGCQKKLKKGWENEFEWTRSLFSWKNSFSGKIVNLKEIPCHFLRVSQNQKFKSCIITFRLKGQPSIQTKDFSNQTYLSPSPSAFFFSLSLSHGKFSAKWLLRLEFSDKTKSATPSQDLMFSENLRECNFSDQLKIPKNRFQQTNFLFQLEEIQPLPSTSNKPKNPITSEVETVS